jgi:hypothetical protein
LGSLKPALRDTHRSGQYRHQFAIRPGYRVCGITSKDPWSITTPDPGPERHDTSEWASGNRNKNCLSPADAAAQPPNSQGPTVQILFLCEGSTGNHFKQCAIMGSVFDFRNDSVFSSRSNFKLEFRNSLSHNRGHSVFFGTRPDSTSDRVHFIFGEGWAYGV